MVKKYVITGGPGTGKSSIILALEKRGEHVIHEAAADYIRLQQAKGIAEPWLDEDFQKHILKLQVQREARIPHYAERVFIDRGFPDGMAYLEENSPTYKEILGAMNENSYEKVFLIEELSEFKSDEIRRESPEEALSLRKKLEQIYASLGCELIIIPLADVDSRVNLILRYIDLWDNLYTSSHN